MKVKLHCSAHMTSTNSCATAISMRSRESRKRKSRKLPKLTRPRKIRRPRRRKSPSSSATSKDARLPSRLSSHCSATTKSTTRRKRSSVATAAKASACSSIATSTSTRTPVKSPTAAPCAACASASVASSPTIERTVQAGLARPQLSQTPIKVPRPTPWLMHRRQCQGSPTRVRSKSRSRVLGDRTYATHMLGWWRRVQLQKTIYSSCTITLLAKVCAEAVNLLTSCSSN